MAKTNLTKTMAKYFDDLHKAEFESGEYNEDADPRQMVKLLRRATNWKNYENLLLVCEYLGAECDDRTETVEGCKAIINEDIEYWKDQY